MNGIGVSGSPPAVCGHPFSFHSTDEIFQLALTACKLTQFGGTYIKFGEIEMVKLTIDSNLLNVRQGIPAMNVLERWQSEGKIELVGAQRLISEIEKHPLQPEANDKVKEMPNVSEPMVWGVSSWGESKWGAEGDVPEYKELAKVLFPKRTYEELTENEQSVVPDT